MGVPETWRMRGVRLRLEGKTFPCGHAVVGDRATCPMCASQVEMPISLGNSSESKETFFARLSRLQLFSFLLTTFSTR